MASDEAGTLAALKRYREIVFDPTVSQYNGRIVKLIGDGTLVEFSSVVDAVDCALSIQRAAVIPKGASKGRIVLRIGINLGDVVIKSPSSLGFSLERRAKRKLTAALPTLTY